MAYLTYGEKIERITEHLQEHPADYQSVISLYKLRSDAIEYEIEQRRIEKKKMVAECRRLLQERRYEESTFE